MTSFPSGLTVNGGLPYVSVSISLEVASSLPVSASHSRTIRIIALLSKCADTSRVVPGTKATSLTASSESKRASGSPDAVSHRRIDPPTRSAEARRPPSGLSATGDSDVSKPSVVAIGSPVAASQNLTVRSSDTETIRAPSGVNAPVRIPASCPVRTVRASPVAASHTRRVRSSEPDTSRAPSGLKATLTTLPSCPFRIVRLSSSCPCR